ncbi:MAG TPA: adenylate/guanylate cyclase domain-containing protein, partial [Candidatus Limnocylindrales bacterium]
MPTATRSAGMSVNAAPIAERRLVSVLFADLVGFTAFAEERDAEDVRETLTRYFEIAADVITRYGGTVEKFIGDAVMAVWGAPTAREDDAERSVRAALDLVDAVRTLGPGIQARARTAAAPSRSSSIRSQSAPSCLPTCTISRRNTRSCSRARSGSGRTMR